LAVFCVSYADSSKAHLEIVDELNLPTIGFWHVSSVEEATWETVRDLLNKK
jgi:hypothetical protein